MSLPVVDWLNSSLKDINHEIFKDVVKVSGEVQPVGDGQVVIISDIKRLTLTLESSDGEKIVLKTISKEELPPGAGRNFASMTGAFDTETFMYSDVLKTMEKLMSDVGDNELIWPDCYHCGDNRFILEDLCESGYKIVPTYKLLDLPHALLVMNGIGKFHGLSKVMKERGLLDISKFKEPFFCKKNAMNENMQLQALDSLVNNIKEYWEPEWSSVADRYREYSGNPNEKYYQIWESSKGIWEVLNHGDFSLRNMLFHYSPGSTKPDAVKFVDFQMCHYSNFGFDLGMLIYGSILPSDREENMRLLLTTYTDSLATTCKRLNYNGPIPTVNEIESSLKALHHFTTQIAIYHISFFIASAKPDVQKRADKFIESFNNDDGFKETPSDLVDYKDEEIKDFLQSEFKRCMKENLF